MARNTSTTSPSTTRPRAPEREGGRVVLYLVLGLGLLFGAGYAAAYLGASDKLPIGTTVGGVDVGGHDPAGAIALLQKGMEERADAPFTARIGGRVEQIPPSRVGLGIDYVASVRQADSGQSWQPRRLWDYYTDGQRLDPVVTLDQLVLARLVDHLNRTDARAPVNGSVTFVPGRFVVTRPVPGRDLDVASVGQAFWAAYLTDSQTVDLPLRAMAPDIDTRALRHFVRHFANRAMAAPITLRFGHTQVRLRPASYAPTLGSRAVNGRLEPTVDAAALDAVVQRKLGRGGPANAPVDATVAIVDGLPKVVPSRPGVTFSSHDVETSLLSAIRSPTRTAKVPASLAPASFTNADARKLRIREEVSTSVVHLPRGARHRSLIAAANKVDGTVLHPGDTFSLRQVLGDTTVSDKAGTALATSIFEAVWLGGLEVGTHATPPTHTGQYPVGLDATLAGGQDLAFTDNVPYGVLVSVDIEPPSPTAGGSLSVTLWSTVEWSVASSTSARSNVVPPGATYHLARHCRPRHGHSGFDVSVTRILTAVAPGAVAGQGSFDARYAPIDAVVCRRGHH